MAKYVENGPRLWKAWSLQDAAPQILDWPWLMGHHLLETHMVNLLLCRWRGPRFMGGLSFQAFSDSAPEISFWTIDVVTCWWVQKKRSLLTYCNQYRSWLFPQLLATLPKTLQITQDFQVQVPKNEGTEPYSRLFWGWVFPLKISLTSIQPI